MLLLIVLSSWVCVLWFVLVILGVHKNVVRMGLFASDSIVLVMYNRPNSCISDKKREMLF
jgi:hypothetical protein